MPLLKLFVKLFFGRGETFVFVVAVVFVVVVVVVFTAFKCTK